MQIYCRCFWAVISGLLFVFGHYVLVTGSVAGRMLDLAVYLEAAKALLNGGNPYSLTYTVESTNGGAASFPYLYPPFLSHVFAWLLSIVDEGGIKLLWAELNFVATILSAIIITRILSPRFDRASQNPEHLLAICLFGTLCFEPLWIGAKHGQVSSIVLLLLLYSIYAWLQSKPLLAGASLGIASLIKISPAILILVFLKTRNVKAITGFVAMVVIDLFWSLLDFGSLQIYRDFISALPNTMNGSLFYNCLMNYVIDKGLLAPLSLEHLSWIGSIIRGSFLFLALFITYRARNNKAALKYLWGCLICIMLVASPILWFHHLTWALIPICILALEAPYDSRNYYRQIAICTAIYCVLSQGNFLFYFVHSYGPKFESFVGLIFPLTVILLGGILAKLSIFGGRYVASEEAAPSR